MDMNKPSWIKVMNWISLFFLIIIPLIWVLFLRAIDEFLFAFLIIVVPSITIGLCLLSFNLIHYFKENNLSLGKWLVCILIFVFGIIFLISLGAEKFIFNIFGIDITGPPVYWNGPSWVFKSLWPLYSGVLIFLVIILVILNKKDN